MSSLTGYTEVLLADGERLRGVLPTAAELARLGLLPDHLRRVAFAMGDPKHLVTEKEEPGFAERLAEYLRTLTAAFARERWDPDTGTWIPFRMAPEDVERIGDAVVRDQLEDLVLRARTAAEITGVSALILGMAEASAMPASEVAPGVTGYIGFRGEPGGDAGGADGGPVGQPAVAAAGHRRTRGGVRRGRGAGDPAPARRARGAGRGAPAGPAEEGAR